MGMCDRELRLRWHDRTLQFNLLLHCQVFDKCFRRRGSWRSGLSRVLKPARKLTTFPSLYTIVASSRH